MEGSVKEGDDLGSGNGSVRIEAARGYAPGDVVGDRPPDGLVCPMSGRDITEGVGTRFLPGRGAGSEQVVTNTMTANRSVFG